MAVSDDDDMPLPPSNELLTPEMARYTTPLSSVPPPHSGTLLSSQRRLSYTPMNLYDSPRTPRMSSLNSSSRLNRWTHQRLNVDDSFTSYETSNAYVPESDFERFAMRLQSKLATEQNRLRDAKATVQYWRKKDGSQQSWNGICAHALILLSEIRITTYRDLIARVNTFHHLSHAQPPPTEMPPPSIYTIFRIDINLSRDYYLKNATDDPNYVFILIGSTGEKTVASQLVEVSNTALLRSRRFRIDEEMVFKNLPDDFQICLSLYVMKIEPHARTPKAIAKKMAVSLFNKFTPPVPNHNTSIGSRKDEDITSGFEPAGHFVLSRAFIGNFTAFLENALYPLEGTAEVIAKVCNQ
uniref:Anillin homology domain-containing protein n=1 Tax=Panagrolaimus sp. ES5 TaxID=591445 RepID=A0AC34GQT1_9BILA